MKTKMFCGTLGAAIALPAPAHADVAAAGHKYPRR